LCRTVHRSEEARIICHQLLRPATSVAANYRAVCHARSPADFIAKLGIVLEEADESAFWLELTNAGVITGDGLGSVLKEANELISIFVSSLRTAKSNRSLREVSLEGQANLQSSI
jgi:four helix bundle protein